MSELATDLDWWSATHYPNDDDDWGPASGRHAYIEDAALTPIFLALTRAGGRSRRHEPAHLLRRAPDPMEEFHRDPLTAPIPTQARAPRRTPPDTGRHHRSRNHW